MYRLLCPSVITAAIAHYSELIKEKQRLPLLFVIFCLRPWRSAERLMTNEALKVCGTLPIIIRGPGGGGGDGRGGMGERGEEVGEGCKEG